MAIADESTAAARRPIKARQSAWAHRWAARLAARGVTPNMISIGSVLFAATAGAALLLVGHMDSSAGKSVLFVLAIVGIQGRLICNLLDGMVAIEGGQKSVVGEIYNDLPDRLADPLILVPVGYAAGLPWSVELGWLAAAMAIFTAYVRVLGRSIGGGIHFSGPMAKQHRMGILTSACAAAAAVTHWGWQAWILFTALAVIVVGCAITSVRRLARIARTLRSTQNS